MKKKRMKKRDKKKKTNPSQVDSNASSLNSLWPWNADNNFLSYRKDITATSSSVEILTV